MRGEKRVFKVRPGRNHKKDLRNWLQRDERPNRQGPRIAQEQFNDDFKRGGGGGRRSRSNSRHGKESQSRFDELNFAESRFSPPNVSHFEEKRSRSPLFLEGRPRKFRSRSRERQGFDSLSKFSPPRGYDEGSGQDSRRFRRSRSRGFDEFNLESKFSPPNFDQGPSRRFPSSAKSYDRAENLHEEDRRYFASGENSHPGEPILKEREIILDEHYRRDDRSFSPQHAEHFDNRDQGYGRSNIGEGKSEERFSEKGGNAAWEKLNVSGPSEEKFQNEDSIPEFNPETSKLSAKRWIKLIEQVANNNKWKSDEKRFHMTSKLAGFARQWYLSMGKNVTRWNDLKVKFIQSFPSEMDFCMHLTNMLNRKKRDNESMVSYFEHKVALLNVCDITGAKAVSCIIEGLTDEKLRREAKEEDFTSVNSLLEFLRAKESGKNHFKEEKEKKKEIPRDEFDIETSSKIEGIICFKCNKMGHKARNCPSFNVCSYCHKKGHFEAECKIKFEEEAVSRSSNKVMFGALADTPTFPQYFKEVLINGTPVTGYVDFSSECVSIRDEIVSTLGLPFMKMYRVIRSFGGSPVSCVGELEATFEVDEAVARVKAYVVPNHIQAVPVIIGQAFTKLPQITITGDGESIRILQRPVKEKTSYFTGSAMQTPHYY